MVVPHTDLPAPPDEVRRIVFLGTPEMAVAPLWALHDAGYEIVLVVTGADKRRGRRSTPSPSPVKAVARQLGLAVSHNPHDAATADADLGVVVAFGQILKRPLLEALPMVNLHFSLLPRWRGAAPVERAILAGDDRTGVCVMAVEEGLDTGGVYASSVVPIDSTTSADQLARQLTEVGSTLLVDTLQRGLGSPEPQVGESTYAAKLTSEDRRLQWAQPADVLDRVVRVGGAWTTYQTRRFKIHGARPQAEPGPGPVGSLHHDSVTTGDGTLQLLEVQPEGKGRVEFGAWAHGARPPAGTVLGSEGTTP